MPQYKNQHYVPKFYFRLFSKNQNTICTFNISNERFIEHATIRGQCSKNYFYSKNTEIESTFSHLEGLSNAKLRKIIEVKNLDCLTEEEKEHLKSHILFQHGRTKHAHDRENDMANYFFNFLKPAMYEKAKEDGEDIPWKDIEETRIVMNSHQTLLMSMMSGILWFDLKIVLLENQSKIDFIFSDNPVVMFNSYFNDIHPLGTTGIASTGLQVFYPINSKLMLFLFDSNFYNVKSLSKVRINKNKDVQRLNGLQILNGDKNIYFENFNSKEKVEEIYKRLKDKKPANINEYEIMGSRVAEDGTYRELLRTSAPKISYNIEKLSFLSHKKLNVPFGIRNPTMVSIHRKITDAVFKGKIKSMDDLDNFIKQATSHKEPKL